MLEQLDPALLSTLPDHVKRNILQLLTQQQSHVTAHEATPGTPPEIAPCLPLSTPHPLALAAGVSITDGVLSSAQVKAAAAEAEQYLAAYGSLAGMGSSSSGGRWHDPSSRGDIHGWVKPAELSGAWPVLSACLELLSRLRPLLAQQGYAVQGGCSFQVACYPGGGARYARHADRRGPSGRQVTALLYLNPEWQQEHGGSLVLYQASSSCQPPGAGLQQGEPGLVVAPVGGRLVLFESQLEHEVLPAEHPRYSITAWYYDGEAGVASAPHTAAAAAAAVPTAVVTTTSTLKGTPEHTGAGSVTHDNSSSSSSGSHSLQLASNAGCSSTDSGGRISSTSSTACNIRVPPATPGTLPDHQQEHAGLQSSGATPSCAAPSAGEEDHQQHSANSTTAESISSSTLAMQGLSLVQQPQLKPKLLVCIASLRDPETPWMLRDIFLQAADPSRVHVAVAWQLDLEADAGLLRIAGGKRTAQYAAQVRQVVLPCQAAEGPCRPRFLAQQLWQDEDFVLQLDAHMRLVPGWDTLCLEQLATAQRSSTSGNAVLSAYPVGYSGDGAAAATPQNAPATLLCASHFDEQGLLRTTGRCLRQRPAAPIPSRFWAAGLSFAPAAWLLEVPYCPHLPHLFFGEEQYMLARMWTRGWDVCAPCTPLAFHQWERSERPSSYQASVKVDAPARAQSLARVKQVLGMRNNTAAAEAATACSSSSSSSSSAPVASHATAAAPLDSAMASTSTAPAAYGAAAGLLATPREEDWAPGGIWGIGTARSLLQWQCWMGVDLQLLQISQAALWGGLPPGEFESGSADPAAPNSPSKERHC